MNRILLLSFIPLILFLSQLQSQELRPGFDKAEYLETLRVLARQADKPMDSIKFPAPEYFQFLYRSPEVGLKNRYDIWVTDDKQALICIRGTVADQTSWLANMYSAMVPAGGSLYLSDNFQFDYKLAAHPKAAVHIGWLIGTAYLTRDMMPKIDSLYQQGFRDFLIMGHSQGGAMAYLLTSYLRYSENIPDDVRMKTYCSAAPKPGNLYYAYDYETICRGGWSNTVVNPLDWVPQSPFTIQTVDDYNSPSLFSEAKTTIKKQKFPKNVAMKYVYNKLDKPTEKARKNFEKYLGNKAYKFVVKVLPEFREPVYYKSNQYSRAGDYIILMPDEGYFKKFPADKDNIWRNHLLKPYYYLAKNYSENTK